MNKDTVDEKRRQWSPAAIAEYVEFACPLSSDEIATWAKKLERPGPDGERELKEALTFAFSEASARLQTKSPDDTGPKQVHVIIKQLMEIYLKLQRLRFDDQRDLIPDDIEPIPYNIDAALRVRFGFGVYDKELEHLLQLARMLIDVANVWPPVIRRGRGNPSVEPLSFVVEPLVRAIEKFAEKPIPSPRTGKRLGVYQIELVHRLAKLLVPSLQLAQIRTMLEHLRNRESQLQRS